MITVEVTDKEATLIANALKAVAEDYAEASNAVLSGYLKRGFLQDSEAMKLLAGRFDKTGMENVVRDFLSRGHKIDAIKYVRQVTLLGLKEAKDYVDSLEARGSKLS